MEGAVKKFLSLIAILVLSISVGALSSSAQQQIASLVTVTQAGLEIQRTGTQDWVTVTRESLVGMGDRIRTDANGMAEVMLFSRSGLIELQPNTELSINRMERTEQGFLISFGLLTGKIHQTLLPVPDVYIGYEFTTPTTSVVTAGGIFDVWLDDTQNTNVLTTDGIVYVGSQRTQLNAQQGLRAEAGNLLSEIITADSAEQLNAGIDGIPVAFITNGDIQLNIRQGPSAQTELLGTVFPGEVERVKGISQDGQWYRIKYGRGHGWVSKNALEAEVETQYLVEYPPNHIERRVTEIAALPVPTETPQTAASASNAVLQDFTLVELELMARLNQWRITDGLWPLKPNTVLRDMARSQANYLLSLASLPDDLHVDSKGRNPRQRALDPAFNWPHYLGNDRVAVGENIYIGNNMNGAINYWQNSPIHRDTTVSVGFREVGVVIVPHPLGSMYVVVFGARPNVLPVLIDPTSNTLYVSSESYRYAAPGDWVTSVKGLQFIPSVLSQVDQTAWQPWARQSSLEQINTFVIAYQGDEDKLLMTNFNPQEDIAWLPSNLPVEGEQAAIEETVLLEVPQLEVPVLGFATRQPQTQTQSTNSFFITNTPVPPIGG